MVALIKKIVGALLGLVVVLVVAGLILPSTVHVERQVTIAAAPDQVFALISDFHAWDAWSPWADLDADATMEITGQGLGQRMTWSSTDPEVGQGTQEIVVLDPPNLLQTHLDFGDQGMAEAMFHLTPEADKTVVTWSLDTDMRAGVPVWLQPINTYFGFLMDAMIGDRYEQGLSTLKAVAEG